MNNTTKARLLSKGMSNKKHRRPTATRKHGLGLPKHIKARNPVGRRGGAPHNRAAGWPSTWLRTTLAAVFLASVFLDAGRPFTCGEYRE